MAFDPITIALEIGSKVIDKIWPDPATKAQAQLELFKLQQSGELAQLTADTTLAKGQLEVNTEEAKSGNLFIAGWRPFIGWVCGVAFAAKYLGGPAVFVAAQWFDKAIILPPIDMTEMLPLLLGMLGLGAMRTTEKLKDKA
jgi:hypothetical protein